MNTMADSPKVRRQPQCLAAAIAVTIFSLFAAMYIIRSYIIILCICFIYLLPYTPVK